ncbi:uncharacterized protein GGS22DRAFT_197631 [Annulohypoxylon maeteangense]|uniref:uncharacterized protein n=1 Tax=Annulohypoxylon maeteangense TaxID=1927788 RepID=UPI002008C5B9|nr:uncharacterized protein GGS22DRAFT_197631 [Annulohypoxylon maeteangense]KAI0880219.1 hypothetical protein GGS22DRAFT_197631 [Annulohypoxylon maeteangense]
MGEKDMRLRLVVRRDGYPEVRLIWNVSLENDPTISKLLEKVNETFPLEIEQKGLENYVVELHDNDGTSFECLHFQTVRSVLKPDDRVFIRALDRDDNKQRRISGRYRISSDGRHLIDGIPFGRRRLKVSSSQAPVVLPPRKRARLAYNQEDLDDDDDDDDFLGDEEDTPMLLITNGEQDSEIGNSSSVRINAEFDDADADAEDDDPDSEAEIDDVNDYPAPEPQPEDSDQDQSEAPSDEDIEDEELEDEDLEDELQDLMKDNADYNTEEEVESEVEQEAGSSDMETSDDGGLNKILALQAAFPSAPAALCKKLLDSSNGDLKATYNGLVNAFEPKLPEYALLALCSSGEQTSRKTSIPQSGAPVGTTSNVCAKESYDATEEDEDQWESAEEEDEEEVPDFVRQFDHRGLPPGSITSGKGLAQMAAVSGSLTNNYINGESETTSTLNESKGSPEKAMEEDDDTSSDDTGFGSEDEDSESESDGTSESDDRALSDSDDDDEDDDSNNSEVDSDGNSVDLEDDDSSMSHNVSSGSNSGSDSLSEDDSEDNSEDDNDDNDDNESGPEESSTRLPLSIQQPSVNQENNSSQDTTSSESSSDSDISSSEDNSEAESSSESENEQVEEEPPSDLKEAARPQIAKESSRAAQQNQLPPVSVNPTPGANPVPVPPGAGKESTKKRNARRRAAKRAKKQAQQATTTDTTAINKEAEPPAPILDEKALFEAKRQELLNAIANGGVEISLSSQLDDSSRASNATKRKRQESDGVDHQTIQEATPAKTPASEDDQSSGSIQKKRRLDVGAGRRMLFGALGLRNPKTKEDEEKLRENLMKDVRPVENPRLKQDYSNAEQADGGEGKSTNDPDAWKNKIIYRAVECCQEGIVLSEPPFPFIQRWDPQQKGYWSEKKNKRGGQSKRAQRNEAHFYQDSRSSKKRKHDESAMWDEEGYDDTFNGIDDTTDADVELNYDDPEDDQHNETNGHTNDASQFTDMDDLPSLPSDLSTLPDLRPGEVQAGMVITWQQWSCSSATGWQPQLSNVTGVVVRIDDDATGVEVCLAKRDRYLDKNEKKYDHKGQRVYDRFEAPDFDEEEEEEDEGFRTMGFAEMQQPKILQQPLPVMTTREERMEPASNRPAENLAPEVEPTTATEDMQTDAPEQCNSELTKQNAPSVEKPQASQVKQGQQTSDGSESGLSQISSPSRQLHESTSQAIGGIIGDRSAHDTSSHGDVTSDIPSDKPSLDISGSGIPSVRQSSAPLFDSHEDDVVVGTPKKIKSKAIIPPSSVGSARSGRQPDYGMDMNDTQPDSFKNTDDGVSNSEGPRGPGSDEDVSTPTPKPNRQSQSTIFKQEGTVENHQSSSPANPSTPSSLSSINTVWNTARTALSSRNTQTPSQSQSQSQSITTKIRALKDQEYEEAMRKLDDFSDDQESMSRVPDSFKQTSQASGLGGVNRSDKPKPVVKPRSNSPQVKISPPPTKRRRSTKPPTQFTLPPGTQVVDLSSDSEPAYAENYADDDVDGTYSPEPDSFPRSNGWVHKKADVKNRKPRNVSAPIGSHSTKKELFSSSQSYQPSLPTSSISNPNRFKARKTSSRF